MATNNPRIRYDIEAGVTGEQDVNALARELDKLAETLEGDLKTQAQASAQALREVGNQQAAIDGFVTLKNRVQEAAGQLQEAQTQAQAFARELAATGNPTRAQAGQMERLRDAVRTSKTEMQDQVAALDRSRAELGAYGIASSEVAQKQRDLTAASRTLADQVKQIGTTAADAAARQQQAANAEIERQRRIADAVASSNARAVRSARSAADARVMAASRAAQAERERAAMVEQYNLREQLSQEALVARSNAVREMYPRLGQAAQASAGQQVAAAQRVEGGLSSLAAQLRAVQTVAIAVMGGTFAGQLIGGVNETAEAFARAGDRIKLVTGEGQAFDSAFEGVQRTALATNSTLESTATLFARLDQAGQKLGRTQEQSLGLVQTINQAIQISGGSAQSADAALTQLIQGLQSGVLRGEEFNSVMEQSPRLAQALADGLGKTTGELRALAQQGVLTTEVVIGALEGQAAAIDQEFDKLSGRPSRALQNLATAWEIYVGNADKAVGASKAAADAIDFLAKNLDTIVGLLLDSGQAVAAFVGLRLAQHFLGIGSAAQVAATQVAASTTAINAASAASATAAVNVGRMATVLSGLKTLSLLGIVTNIQDIGTWLGESAAKLAGYKDLTEELAREERLAAEISAENARQKAAMAQATQLAIEAARGLTPEARVLTSEFDKLRAAGESTGDALADLSKKANLQDTTGIQAFGITLRDLAVQGKASGDQIREAMAAALQGEDLAKFEVLARTAFAGTRDEAELLAIALDSSLREAINRSGADFASISGGMSTAAISAINDTELIINNLDRLKDQGVDTAAALTASLGKGIQTADSQAALQAVRDQIESVRKVLGDKVADGLLDQLATQAEKAKKEVGGLQDALGKLGITSDADLKKAADQARNLYERVREGGGSAREQADAFQKMADAAIRSGDSTAMAYAKSQAAAHGFEIAVDKAGKTVVRRMGEAAKATQDYSSSINKATQEVQEHIGWLDRMAERNAEVKSSMKMDGQGFAADESGNRIAMGGDLNTLTGIASFLKAAGIEDDATARRIATEFSDGKGNIPYFSNPGQKRYGGDTISMALLRAAERITFAGNAVGGGDVPGVPTTVPKQGARDVNFNLSLNGESYGTVETSEQGQAVMNRFLDELQRGKMRSTRR